MEPSSSLRAPKPKVGGPPRRVCIIEPPRTSAGRDQQKPVRRTKPGPAQRPPDSRPDARESSAEHDADDVMAMFDLTFGAVPPPVGLDAPDTSAATFLDTPLYPAAALMDENAVFESIERTVHQTLRGAREAMVRDAREPSRRYHDDKSADVWGPTKAAQSDTLAPLFGEDEDALFVAGFGAATSSRRVYSDEGLVSAVPEVHDAAALVHELRAMKSPLPTWPIRAQSSSYSEDVDSGCSEGPLTSSSPDTLVDILEAIDRRSLAAPGASYRGASPEMTNTRASTAATTSSASPRQSHHVDPELFDPAQYAMALLHEGPRTGCPASRHGHSGGVVADVEEDVDADADEEEEAMERALIAEYFPELALSGDVTDARALHKNLTTALRTLREPEVLTGHPGVLGQRQTHAVTDVLDHGEDPEEIRHLLHFSLAALQQKQQQQQQQQSSMVTPAMPSVSAAGATQPTTGTAPSTNAAAFTATPPQQLRRANRELLQQIIAALPPIPEDMKAELARQRRLLEHLTEVQQAHLRRLSRQQQEETRRRVQAPLSDPTFGLTGVPSRATLDLQRQLGLDKVVEPFAIGRQLQRAASDARQPLPPLVTITTAPASVSADELAAREAKFYEQEMYRLRDTYGAMLEREQSQRKTEQTAFRDALARQQTTLTSAHTAALSAVQREARLNRRENEALAYQLTAAQEVVHQADTRQLLDRHEKKTQKMLKGTVEVLQSYTATKQDVEEASRRRQAEIGPAPDLSRPRYEDATGHRKWPRPRRSASGRTARPSLTSTPAGTAPPNKTTTKRARVRAEGSEEASDEEAAEAGEESADEAAQTEVAEGQAEGDKAHSEVEDEEEDKDEKGAQGEGDEDEEEDEKSERPSSPDTTSTLDEDVAVIPVAPRRRKTRSSKAADAVTAVASEADVAAVMPRKQTVKTLARGEAVAPYKVHLPGDVQPSRTGQRKRAPSRQKPTTATTTTTKAPAVAAKTTEATLARNTQRTSAGAIIHKTPLMPKDDMAAIKRPSHATASRTRTPPQTRKVPSALANSPYRQTHATPTRRSSARRRTTAKSAASPAEARAGEKPVDHDIDVDVDGRTISEGDDEESVARRENSDEEAAVDATTMTTHTHTHTQRRFVKEETVALMDGGAWHRTTQSTLCVPDAKDLAAAEVGRPLWLLTPASPPVADQIIAELAAAPGATSAATWTTTEVDERHRYAAQQRVEQAYALPTRFHASLSPSLSTAGGGGGGVSAGGSDAPPMWHTAAAATPPEADVFFFGAQVPTYEGKWAAVEKAERAVRELARKVQQEQDTQDWANLRDHQRRQQGLPTTATFAPAAADGTSPALASGKPSSTFLSSLRVRADADRHGAITSETDKERAAAAAALAAHPTRDGDAAPTLAFPPSTSPSALVAEAMALREARRRLAQLRASMLTPCCAGAWDRTAEAMAEADRGEGDVEDTSEAQRRAALSQQITSEVIHSVLGAQREAGLFATVMQTLEADLLSLLLQHDASQAFATVAESPKTDAIAPALSTRPRTEKEKEDEATLMYFLEEAILQRLEATAASATPPSTPSAGGVQESDLWAALEAAMSRLTHGTLADGVSGGGQPRADAMVREVVRVPGEAAAPPIEPGSSPQAQGPAVDPVRDGSPDVVTTTTTEKSATPAAVARHLGPLHAAEVVGDFTPSTTLPSPQVAVTGAPATTTTTTMTTDDAVNASMASTGQSVPLVISVGPSAAGGGGGGGGELRLVVDVAPLFYNMSSAPSGCIVRSAQTSHEEPVRAVDTHPEEDLRDVEVERSVPPLAVPLPVPVLAPAPASVTPASPALSAPPPLVVPGATPSTSVPAPVPTSTPAWTLHQDFLRGALCEQERIQRDYVEDHEDSAREAMGLLWQWRREQQQQQQEQRDAARAVQAAAEAGARGAPQPDTAAAASSTTTRHSDSRGEETAPRASGPWSSPPAVPSPLISAGGGRVPGTALSATSTSTSVVSAVNEDDGHAPVTRGSGGRVKDPITRFVLEWLDAYGAEERRAQQRDEVVGGLHAAAAKASAEAAVSVRGQTVRTSTSRSPSSSSLSAPGSSWLSSTSASSFRENGGHVFVRDARIGADRFVAAARRRRPVSQRRAPGAFTPVSAQSHATTTTTTTRSNASNATTRYTRPTGEHRAAPRPVLEASAPPEPRLFNTSSHNVTGHDASTLVPMDATFLKTNYTSSTSRATYREGSGSSFTSSDEGARRRRGHGVAHAPLSGSPSLSPPPAFLYQNSVLSGINDSCVGPSGTPQKEATARPPGAVALHLSHEALRDEVLRLQAYQRQREADGAATLGFDGPFLRQLQTKPVTALPGASP